MCIVFQMMLPECFELLCTLVFVQMASLPRIFRLFRGLGLRHLVVVDINNRVSMFQNNSGLFDISINFVGRVYLKGSLSVFLIRLCD